MSKKDKRWESKKRKVNALLWLIESEKHEPKKVRTEDSDSDSSIEAKSLQATSGFKVSKYTTAEAKQKFQEWSKKKKQEKRPIIKFSEKYLKKENTFISGYAKVFTVDIQQMLLHATNAQAASMWWCDLSYWTSITKLVLVIVEDVGASDCSSSMKFTKSFGKMNVTFATPGQYGSTISKELFRKMKSKTKLKKDRHSSRKNPAPKNLFVPKDESAYEVHTEDKCQNTAICRVDLLLNLAQMVQENYPLPVADIYKNYVCSHKKYKPVSCNSPMFGMDCEMVLTTAGKNELARVSIINEYMETVLDTLCKPYNHVLNYLTQFSGITKKMLDPVKTRLSDVQKMIFSILPPDAILVGQSLGGDLHALQIFHPYAIDTSLLYNLSGESSRKTGLKRLTAHFLNRDIQCAGDDGHCSVEDSAAALELVFLKLKKGLLFGDAVFGDGYDMIVEEQDLVELRETFPQLKQISTLQTEDSSDQVVSTMNSNLSKPNSEMKLEMRTNFFEGFNLGNGSYDSIFTLIKERIPERTGVIIGNIEEDKSLDTEFVMATDDDHAVNIFQTSNKFLRCIVLNDICHTGNSTVNTRKGELEKIDNRIKDLIESIHESNVLVTVMLSGITDNENVNDGLCAIKITA